MLLDRNRRIKPAPQRFQDSHEHYDIIVTCEERCFTLVCEEAAARPIRHNRPVHVINFDIKDTPEDAMVGARAILAVALRLEECKDLDEEAEAILTDYIETKGAHPILYTVLYY